MTPVTLSHSGYVHLFSLHSFPENCKWIDNPPVWCTELHSSPAAECILFPVIATWAKPGVLWCGWSHISFPQSSPLIQTVEVYFLPVKQVFNKLHPIKYRARLLLFWVSWHLQPSCQCQGLACSETHSHVLNFSNWVCSLLWSGSRKHASFKSASQYFSQLSYGKWECAPWAVSWKARFNLPKAIG